MPDPYWWRDAEPSRPRPVTGGIQINSTRGDEPYESTNIY